MMYLRPKNFGKSILHNIGVVLVGLGLGYSGRMVDALFGMRGLHFANEASLGGLFLAIGFAIRVWAAFYFYEHEMKVISLIPQNTLITGGPYRFSRNPLYLGGNVFIFLGGALLMRSTSALIITILQLPLTDWMIRREEKQLERTFGQQWVAYKRRVRRWI